MEPNNKRRLGSIGVGFRDVSHVQGCRQGGEGRYITRYPQIRLGRGLVARARSLQQKWLTTTTSGPTQDLPFPSSHYMISPSMPGTKATTSPTHTQTHTLTHTRVQPLSSGAHIPREAGKLPIMMKKRTRPNGIDAEWASFSPCLREQLSGKQKGSQQQRSANLSNQRQRPCMTCI